MAKREPRRKCLTHFLRKTCMLWKHWLYVNVRNTGKTLVTRTQGTKITSDDSTDYVFEVSLADLQSDETEFRKFKLITEDVEGKNCLTNFRGMGLTHDQTYIIVKKNSGSWLTVMWASRLPMVISFIYSAWVLLQNVTVRFRRPLCMASTSLPNLEEDNGNHDPRGEDKWLERSGQ